MKLSSGVQTLIKRMETHPEEFFSESKKWHFIYSANFKDVMTEPEKGAIHEALATVRRAEFEAKVVETLMEIVPEQEDNIKWEFGKAPMKMSGQPVYYGGKK